MDRRAARTGVRAQGVPCLVAGVVRDVGGAVEQVANAVAAVGLHNAVVVLVGVTADDLTHLAEAHSGLDRLNGLHQALPRMKGSKQASDECERVSVMPGSLKAMHQQLWRGSSYIVGDLDELLGLVVHVADNKGLVEVTVVAVVVGCDVNVDDVALLRTKRPQSTASSSGNIARDRPGLSNRRAVACCGRGSRASHPRRGVEQLTCSSRRSGMPWQMTSFTDVHTDFGKL